VNGPLLGDDPPSASRTHCGYGDGRDWLRRGSWPAPRGRNAEACSSRRPRAGNSSWCVMPGRDAHLPAKRRSARRPGDRSNHVERVIDVVVAPRTPGIRFAAAGTRLGGCSASADRRPRCAYSSARGSERRYADDRCSRRRLPGTSGSGVYQQLYLQRRPARCLKPHRLTPFRVTNDATRAPVHTAHERLMPCTVPPSWARRAQHRGASS
jgi:hypothetical protein